jgi:rare lipoprotein A (peptidoglycan hydrolase)
MGAALAASACKRQSPTEVVQKVEEKTQQRSKASPSQSTKRDSQTKSWEGDAVWYDVPKNSLAKRRAGKGELTAAHNRLRLGAMVRVTHLANGKSVIVRITDRGITNRANIDLCREAAEELGMISEGRARVRMDLLPDDNGTNAVSDSTAAHP